ncbi:hypothetical protein [Rhizorhabdus dicambivorans]|uniref:DUF2946 domain-containing protein n=1 Tax=Rhizorhabdus dicambivorans TaxID=1850238 RepID=A0A2A4G2X2_9SPHN|nr:hypothetical protein [Rhizorhabdus dicambivorans]ATE65091.1 hypothetical protein CMV14_12295 [Rhizorhabdus dicambivorans]PCE44364.1 hypothetical protein COO09_01680 [Rhizorhabdus dicambivorans]
MQGLRNYFRRHAGLAMLLVALALAVRALVPAGYMAGTSSTGLTVELCSGVAGESITIALPTDPAKDGHGKAQADGPCSFAALGLPAGPVTDPIQLALAIAFILLLGLLGETAPPVARRSQIRPPLRGPPLAA